MHCFIATPRDAAHRDELLAQRRFSECEFYIIGKPGESIADLAKLAPKGATIITPDGEWTPEPLKRKSESKPIDIATWCEHKRTPRRGDMAVITCFFNPAGYKTLRANYDAFKAHLDACRVPLYTVELAHDDNLHTIADALHVRAKSRLFHKENLLNLALQTVPDKYTKIAWVDCDFIFSRDDWATLTSELLDDYPAVQPCQMVTDLNQDGTEYRTRATVAHKGPDMANRPGGAWAIRREILEAAGGLYDKCVVGSGDMVHTHAGFLGNMAHPFFWNYSTGIRAQARQWARGVFSAVQGRIACPPVKALHLFHGTFHDKQYWHRDKLMPDIDPDTWLTYNADGVLEWTHHADADVVKGVADYFRDRREDGIAN